MFHVPNHYRVRHGPLATTDADGNTGAFLIPAGKTTRGPIRRLSIIASDGHETGQRFVQWEHVSVKAHLSASARSALTPTWTEMCYVKDLFWDAEDVVMQLHPRRSVYVNMHPGVLHLWRPHPASGLTIPEPPLALV
jgi:hypothetical protein